MIEQRHWMRVISWLLRNYLSCAGPFSPSKLYDPYVDPAENESLLAKMDLERAIEAVGQSAEKIVIFLQCEEEGWFFEGRARCYQLLEEAGLLGEAPEERGLVS